MATPLYGIVYFLPALIQQLKYDSLISNLLTVPVHVFAMIFTILIARSSDKKKERPLHLLFAAIMTMIGFIFLSFLPFLNQYILAYLFCFIAVAGFFFFFFFF